MTPEPRPLNSSFFKVLAMGSLLWVPAMGSLLWVPVMGSRYGFPLWVPCYGFRLWVPCHGFPLWVPCYGFPLWVPCHGFPLWVPCYGEPGQSGRTSGRTRENQREAKWENQGGFTILAPNRENQPNSQLLNRRIGCFGAGFQNREDQAGD